MKALVIILAGLYGAWHFTDLNADSGWYNTVAPLMVAGFFLALLFWVILRQGQSARGRRGSGFGAGYFGDNDGGGGDIGGGDSSC
jgi:hypothetical protein